MNYIKNLRNFGTIYLWIFVVKVLQVCGSVEYRTDTDGASAVGPALLMKPYTYQIFDDYTDELLNERNAVATPMWQTLDKYLYYKHLPLIATTKGKSILSNGNSMASREITFENLNDFGSYKIKNAIWPKQQKQQQNLVKANGNNDNDINQRRHSLQQFVVVRRAVGGDGGDKQSPSMTNIRYKPIPIIMENHFKSKDTRTTKKSKGFFNDANAILKDKGDDDGENDVNDLKENLFPLKDDNTLNVNDDDGNTSDGDGDNSDDAAAVAAAQDKNGIANSNGNGNENLNYADNNELNTNYLMAQSTDNDHNRDTDDKSQQQQQQQYSRFHKRPLTRKNINKSYDKRAKPSVGHTPFLPAVSGGAMTNLGKFFRDLSKNVHVSEQYQWDADEQKLLEGDPNFGNIKHHLTKPNAATDQQTAEWIKAIRFYRPSQKIRSLVAMNPHGQWDHSSQFIDPNYMWVGLGK